MYIITLKEPAATNANGEPSTHFSYPYCDSANAHLGILRFYTQEPHGNALAVFPISNVLGVVYVKD